MNPLFRIDFSISDSLKIVRKSVLIYETIIIEHIRLFRCMPEHMQDLINQLMIELYSYKRP